MNLLEGIGISTGVMKISEPQAAAFATIGEVFEDGVTLIFDGQSAATGKHYQVNTSVVFKPGNRVKICKDSGTYVVEYVVGAPKKDETTAPDAIGNFLAAGDQISFGYVRGGRFGVHSADDGNTYYVIWDDYGKLTRAGLYVGNHAYKENANKDYDLQFRSNASGKLEFKRVRDTSWTTIL